MKRVDREINIIDHALSLFMILSATYVSGAAIGSMPISYYFMGLALASTAVGYLISRVTIKNGWHRFAAWLYPAIAILPWIFLRDFNKALPDGGFPFQLIITGVLSWMLILTQLVTWRDTVLCFQVVPCIAIFGLVGAYDYYWTPFLFFAFLMGACSLFFRAHARHMIETAERALSPVEAYGMNREKADDMTPRVLWERVFESGAWRWMAGGEWALVSALVIVLCSVLGAPVIRFGATPVTQAIRLSLPRLNLNRNNTPFRPPPTATTTYRVGNGPLSLSNQVIAAVGGNDVTRYWRNQTYERQTMTGWSTRFNTSSVESRSSISPEELRASIPTARTSRFSVRMVIPASAAITPGDVLSVELPGRVSILGDGTVRMEGSFPASIYNGVSLQLDQVPDQAESVEPPDYSPDDFDLAPFVSPKVRAWAQEITVGAANDMDKARKIRAAIEQRCKYNLRAPAVPSGNEPAEYFLFESKEGYCDLFATAMVTAARVNGLKARIASGYLNRQMRPDEEGYSMLREKDGHMWAEIYFKDLGWVVFDATEGAQDITPEGDDTKGGSLWDKAKPYLGYAGLALVGAAGFLLVWGIKPIRRQPLPAKQESIVLYGQFLRVVEKRVRKPKRLSETPSEYLQRVRPNIADWDATWKVHQEFEHATFGPGTLSEESAGTLRTRVKEFKRSFKATPDEAPRR